MSYKIYFFQRESSFAVFNPICFFTLFILAGILKVIEGLFIIELFSNVICWVDSFIHFVRWQAFTFDIIKMLEALSNPNMNFNLDLTRLL